ncbi:MAG: 16S rRNA (cytidine(1402)-2'-O)-methyltransferase [Bacteroidales bacterium]|jgi:16S rRNA (cytidine1402-2'-O)-methyltransferase|nr:16S rRNA (cytidine(1402)-2'-O)-methyltransferase [Bacteroidales bacterium]
MGSLVIVPTPIGNLQDITLRALSTLKSADIILAEDTRQTGKLLKHFEISTPMRAYHKFNEHAQLQNIVETIAQNTLTALVSDAGTPSISDPGFLLTRACILADIPIECLPGATAFVPALVVSGFSSDRFCFEGFLPHKKGRQTRFLELKEEQRTIIFYESPHRILKTITQIQEFFGERNLVVVREISKIFEEIIRGTAGEVITHFSNNNPKGECVLIVEGHKK